jgi:DNA-binding CsgD family transcriptional regulator
MGLLDIAELRTGVLAAIRELVPSDWVSLNDMTPDAVVAVVVDPPLEDRWVALFAELGHENPIYRLHTDTGDGRAYRFSDVTSRRKLEATRLYQEFYEPLGVKHQIAFTLPSDVGRTLAIALSRRHENFSAAERRFLNRARPYLIQAYRNAVEHSALAGQRQHGVRDALIGAGLTAREAEVMTAVAHGASSSDAAARLGLSERTVEKHLERVYRKLGVTTRSAAAARAWELASTHR